jgi:uncharacterized integral membrane protein
LIDVLLPATDAGVLAQVIAVFVIGAAVTAVTWRRREWRLLAIGGTFLALALMGLRALH